MGLLFIVISAVIGLYMAWTIGANDFANSMGSAVGSKSISVRWAIILGAICELTGSILVGMYVSDTIRKGIVVPEDFARLVGGSETHAAAMLALGMTCALLGSSIWVHAATCLGMPVSTSHAIVGAVTGFGIAAAGWAVVDWRVLGWIGASWIISPFAGLIFGYLMFKLIHVSILSRSEPIPAAITFTPNLVFLATATIACSVLYKGHVLEALGVKCWWFEGHAALIPVAVIGFACAALSKVLISRYLKESRHLPLAEQLTRVEAVFAPLVVIAACGVAFAHGANDVANAIGPLAAVDDIMRGGSIHMKGTIPLWMLGLGGLGIVLGLVTYGHKVMRTIGTEITVLTPSRGVAASIATTATVLVCSRLGWPVSTSHTIVGAVIGVGLARGVSAVNLNVTRQIVINWLLTVPAAAIVTVVLFLAGCKFNLDMWLTQAIESGAGLK